MENSINVTNLKTEELMNLYGSLLKELNDRNVVRTYNSPIGDYAEWLFSEIYDLELEQNSNKGYDVIDNKNNIKYQIKSRWFSTQREGRQLNVIREYEKKEFDYLIVIFFNKNFSVQEAYKISHEVVGVHGKFRSHQNGYVLTVNSKVIEDSRVIEITKDFKS